MENNDNFSQIKTNVTNETPITTNIPIPKAVEPSTNTINTPPTINKFKTPYNQKYLKIIDFIVGIILAIINFTSNSPILNILLIIIAIFLLLKKGRYYILIGSIFTIVIIPLLIFGACFFSYNI